MKYLETETAISSLTQMRSYYQSRYSHYLAMATSAKENWERVELLLQDLSDQPSIEEQSLGDEELGVEKNRQRAELVVESESKQQQSDESLILEGQNGVVSSTPYVEAEETATVSQVEQMAQLLANFSKAMSVIGKVSELDSGKTLHFNYLKKMLEREFSHPMNSEVVKLYLNEGIEQGYLDNDEFDPNCYRAQSRVIESSPHREISVSPQKNSAAEIVEKIDSLPSSPPNRQSYNLPPSNKLKPTLLETIKEYITRYSPKRFSIEDIINYLYSKEQQQDWSRQRKNLVRSCVSNALSRKAYLNKHWKRVKPGIYRPL